MSNIWNAGSQSRDTTLFDARDRRKTISRDDGSKWSYDYNERGEVLAGARQWGDAAPVNGQQYGYSFDSFDSFGNRTGAMVNGRVSAYTPNALNQITQRGVPGAVDLIGTASATASVTVNGAAAARHGSYFYKELSADNLASAVDVPIATSATAASGTTTRQQHAFLAQTPESFTHDFDGNLTGDGRWTYTWDAENRLIAQEAPPSVPAIHRRKLVFDYDAQGRRIRKQVWHWVAAQNRWVPHHTLRFAYDGWNLMAELTETGKPVRSYAWGLDVSGTPQGAGGVGGMLFEQVHFGGKTMGAAYDLNGNVTAMVDMATGTPAALFEYGPFGEPIRASGEYAELNPFRFSTHYTDAETGLVYAKRRYYQPVTGRFLSRDPLQEMGGANLFAFVKNDSVNSLDPFGLQGPGHHRIPWSIFNGEVSKEIQRFFDSDLNRIFNEEYTTHNFKTICGISHAKYNAAVKEALDEFLGGKQLHQMTFQEAKTFAEQIRSADRGSLIGKFNRGIQLEAHLAQKFGSTALRAALAEAGRNAARSSIEKAKAKGAFRGSLARGTKVIVRGIAIYFVVKATQEHGVAGGIKEFMFGDPTFGNLPPDRLPPNMVVDGDNENAITVEEAFEELFPRGTEIELLEP